MVFHSRYGERTCTIAGNAFGWYNYPMQNIKAFLLAAALIITMQYAQAAWTNPSSTAPNNNTDTPVNIGGTLQQKLGSLAVNTAVPGDTVGLTVFGGTNLNGNTNITGAANINGSIKIADGTQAANRVLVSDANGNAHWVDISTLIPAGSGSNGTNGSNGSNGAPAPQPAGGVYNMQSGGTCVWSPTNTSHGDCDNYDKWFITGCVSTYGGATCNSAAIPGINHFNTTTGQANWGSVSCPAGRTLHNQTPPPGNPGDTASGASMGFGGYKTSAVSQITFICL